MVWNTKQITLGAATVTQLIPRAVDRKRYFIIPAAALSLFVGSTENVSVTTGMLCTQAIPFPWFEDLTDPNQEVWGIITAGGTVCILEEFYGPLDENRDP